LLVRAHLVAGQLDARQVLVSHRTLAGTTLRVDNEVGGLSADGAPIVCGAVRTSDATLYLIGRVLPVR
jgi:hypothetical protein